MSPLTRQHIDPFSNLTDFHLASGNATPTRLLEKYEDILKPTFNNIQNLKVKSSLNPTKILGIGTKHKVSSMLVSTLVLVTSITLASAASRHRQGLRAPPPSGRPLPSEQWFEQRLDHFRVTERRTWKQRWGLTLTCNVQYIALMSG